MAVIVLEHEGRKRLVSYPTSWEDLMVKIKGFLSLPEDSTDDNITVLFHPRWSDVPLELDPSALQELPNKAQLTVALGANNESDNDEDRNDSSASSQEQDTSCSGSSTEDESQLVPPLQQTTFTINVDCGQEVLHFSVRSTTPMHKILDYALNRFWTTRMIHPNSVRWVYKNSRICGSNTVGDLGMEEGDTIIRYVEQVGGKPAIYLLCSEALPALTLAVDLSEDWELTVLYPPTDNSKLFPSKSSAAWTVDVGTCGIMSDQATNIDTSCLFWEAKSVFPLGGSVINQGTFTPNSPNLTPARSRILEANDLIPYLYKCLEALCLTPAMRTDFITFWLPKFYELHQQNFDVAINFVEQAEYEKAARLTFSKEPDAVVRVFMVFGGVLRGTEEHANWMANQGGPETPEGWRDVVGISKEILEVMADNTKFRAVEWGAMHAMPDM